MGEYSEALVPGAREEPGPVSPVEPLPWLSVYQLVGGGLKGQGMPGPPGRRGALGVRL